MDSVRDSRRTSVITLVSGKSGRKDVIRACEPECRNETLLDLGVPHRGSGGWTYRSKGDATVTAAWSGITYHVSWKRIRPTALPCDHCGDEWMSRMPELIARAAERSAALKGTLPATLTPFPARRADGGAPGVAQCAPGPGNSSDSRPGDAHAPTAPEPSYMARRIVGKKQ